MTAATPSPSPGNERDVDSRRHLDLGHNDEVLRVDEGRVDVFVVGPATTGARRLFLTRIETGDLLVCVDLPETVGVELVGVGSIGTRVRRASADLADAMVAWPGKLVGELTAHPVPPPTADWDSLRERVAMILERHADSFEVAQADDRERLRQHESQRVSALVEASTVLSDQRGGSFDAELLALDSLPLRALAIALRSLGRTLPSRDASVSADLQAAFTWVGVTTRAVVLSGRWWTEDCGPLVGLRPSSGKDGDPGVPVSLVWESRGYYLTDTTTLAGVRVTPEIASQLGPRAYAVLSRLPDRAMSLWDLLVEVIRGFRGELRYLGVLGLLIGLAGIALPIATAVVVDESLAWGARDDLMRLGIVIALIVFAGAIFSYAQNLALLRVEGEIDKVVHASLWERLLALSTRFFHTLPSGELMNRMQGIGVLKATLASGVLPAAFSAPLVLIFAFELFLFDRRLAAVAMFFTVLLLAPALLLGRYIAQHRQLAAQEGLCSAAAMDLIRGIRKIRLRGAEPIAFARWAKLFGVRTRLALNVANLEIGFDLWPQLIAALGTATVIWLCVDISPDARDMPIGVIMGFLAGFTLLLDSTRTLLDSVFQIARILPLVERIEPVLAEAPKRGASGTRRASLKGRITLDKVAFGYGHSRRPVLREVSFDAAPGGIVAIAGPSGAGKTTLLRLMLGFDAPTAGRVEYDGVPLEDYDLSSLRRQFGVVLQDSGLLTNDVFTNIAANRAVSMEEAWDAARKAGIAEEIEAMSLQMKTFVGENGGMLSAGQRQRILIARALVKSPKILFLDEASSALDNRTQREVMQRVKALGVTTVVIAHRLSTIQDADQILFLDDGKVVESGTYDELIEQGGRFASMARRQLY